MSFVYDDSVNIPNNKTDGNRASVPSEFVASDANSIANALSDTRTAIRGGDYHGARDMSGGLPAVAPSGESRWTTQSGKPVFSANAGPYIWIKAVDYINADDPRFGVPSSESADCSAGLLAAINACVFTTGKKRVLALNARRYTCKSNILAAASLGFTMVGEGKWASQLVFDPDDALDDGLTINSSQHVTLEGFALFGKSANPTGKMLNFAYAPVVNAAYGITLRDLWFDSDDTRGAMTYGIYWDDSYGNNSEVNYWGCQIDKFLECGIFLPGTQQKAHFMYGVQINGAWDGVAANANGGKYGVRAGGGIAGAGGCFSFRGGGVGYCRVTAFAVEYPNDPVTIDDVQSEGCYRFLGIDGTVPINQARIPLNIRNCRIDSLNLFDPNGLVQYSGVGPFVFEGNTIHGGHGGVADPAYIPQIRIATGSQPYAIRIRNNDFITPSSDTVSPIIFDGGSVNYPHMLDVRNNLFSDSGGNLSYRNEILDQKVAHTVSLGMQKEANDLWSIDYTLFTAAAASQTVTLQATLPKGITYQDFFVHTANYFVAPAGDVYMKVGTTSGGDELLAEVKVSDNPPGDAGVFGKQDAYVGTSLATAVGGHMPSYTATSSVFVTVRRSTGNLGNGTTTLLTRGLAMFPVKYRIPPRYLT